MHQEPNRPIHAKRPALSGPQIVARLAALTGWKLWGDGETWSIEKTYAFESYLQAMAFANAVAFLAEQKDHHPILQIGYKSCSVRWRSHDVAGISERDFTCAALVDELRDPPQSGSKLG